MLVLVLLGDVLLLAVTCDVFFCMAVHHNKGILVLGCSLCKRSPRRKVLCSSYFVRLIIVFEMFHWFGFQVVAMIGERVWGKFFPFDLLFEIFKA